MGDTLSFIESWGRGTINIINECKTANIPEPNFYEEHGVVKIVFELTGINKFQNGKLNGRLNGRLNEKQKNVLSIINKNPGIQLMIIAEKTGVSIFTLNKYVKIFIDNQLIEHRGSKKTGGYYAI